MRVFRMTYKDSKGDPKQSRKWAVEFRDHRETIHRISGFTDKNQTRELGRKVEKLVATRANHQPPDPTLHGWFESMPPKVRAKLVRLELLDSRQVAANQGTAEMLRG